MVLDASLLNTQQYKVRIKGKVEQVIEKGDLGHPRLRSPTLLSLFCIYIGLMGIVFTNGLRDWYSIPSGVLSNTPIKHSKYGM